MGVSVLASLPLLLAQAAPVDPAVQASGGGLDRFLAMLVSGVALGAIYALLALGFVIIFKATQVVNFAHGAIAAVGAYLTAYFAVTLNFPGTFIGGPQWVQWSLSAIVAILMTAVVGLILERLFIRPMIGEPLFSVAIITLGIDILVRTITDDYIGTGVRPVGDPWGAGILTVGGIRIAQTQVVTVVVAAAAMVAVAAFFRSRTGIAMRATAFDQEAAMAQGIGVGRIFALSWGIGAALAAIAGIFASVFPRSPGVMATTTAFFAFRAFPAVILGGLDSVGGAVIGGFVIGIVEVAAGTYLSPYSGVLGVGFQGIVPYLVMLLVLLVRPYGLFGTKEIRRV